MSENLYTLHEIDYSSTNIQCSINYEDKPISSYHNWHSSIDIIMILDSTLLINVSNTKLYLNEGDIIFIPPDTTHSIDYSSSACCLVFKANISLLNDIKSIKEVLTDIYPILILSPEKDLDIYERIRKNIFLINTIKNENLINCEMKTYSLLLEILDLISQKSTNKNITINTFNNKNQEYIINEICEYITNHCTEKLTLDDISKISGFSKYHFSRLFKQYTDLTFCKYLNKKRINLAESLLGNMEITILDIALSSGFNSLSTFNRIFKQEKRCTPSQYRKMYIS